MNYSEDDAVKELNVRFHLTVGEIGLVPESWSARLIGSMCV